MKFKRIPNMLNTKNITDKIKYSTFSLTAHLISKNLYKKAGIKYSIKDIETLKIKRYKVLNIELDKNEGTAKKLNNLIALINKRNPNIDKNTI